MAVFSCLHEDGKRVATFATFVRKEARSVFWLTKKLCHLKRNAKEERISSSSSSSYLTHFSGSGQDVFRAPKRAPGDKEEETFAGLWMTAKKTLVQAFVFHSHTLEKIGADIFAPIFLLQRAFLHFETAKRFPSFHSSHFCNHLNPSLPLYLSLLETHFQKRQEGSTLIHLLKEEKRIK